MDNEELKVVLSTDSQGNDAVKLLANINLSALLENIEARCPCCKGSGMYTRPREESTCKRCNGSGTYFLPEQEKRCNNCSGKGIIQRPGEPAGTCKRCAGAGSIIWEEVKEPCMGCGATGKFVRPAVSNKCNLCVGTGRVHLKDLKLIQIPAALKADTNPKPRVSARALSTQTKVTPVDGNSILRRQSKSVLP